MNDSIPSCGCYNSGNFYRYKIKDVRVIALDSSNDQSPEQIVLVHSQIKQHLYVNGTIVGAFHVLSNIYTNGGKFKTAKNPEGVYLECVGVDQTLKSEVPSDGNSLDACIYDYVDGKATASNTTGTALTWVGCHAVSVIGWGMAPVSRSLMRPDIERLYPSLKTSETDPSMVMVPYWWVRNSWGTSYAEGGYFKMAAYPFNRISCMERYITITKSDNTRSKSGGCILFSSDTVILDSFTANNQKGRIMSATTTTENKDVGMDIGFFPGASSSPAVGDLIPYTQSSYTGDVLPRTGDYTQTTAPVAEKTPPPQEAANETPLSTQQKAQQPPKQPRPKWFWAAVAAVVAVIVAVIVAVLLFLYFRSRSTTTVAPVN
jgi:hypothetical protein